MKEKVVYPIRADDMLLVEEADSSIRSFKDLRVYQRLYNAMLVVIKEIIPSLPKEEKFDLADQMRRASKAAPELIAEGFSGRYHKKYWNKYLVDSMGECNEMIHHLSVCIDIYYDFIDVAKCKELLISYDIACKQITTLGKVWKNYHDDER